MNRVETQLEVFKDGKWTPATGNEDVYYEVPVNATLDIVSWDKESNHPKPEGVIGAIEIYPPLIRVDQRSNTYEVIYFPPEGNNNIIYEDHFGGVNAMEQIQARRKIGWELTPALKTAIQRVAQAG